MTTDRPAWLYEDGIGERRAALVAGGRLCAMAIERDDDGVRAGTTTTARLLPAGDEGLRIVALDGGGEAVLAGPAATLTDGAALPVTIRREALPERSLVKRPRAVIADAAMPAGPGPDLLARITATPWPVERPLPHQPDALEAAGWSEGLAEAASGDIAFTGGLLRAALTPAMTVIDVDGARGGLALALTAAAASADAILRFGIAGSIVIDMPTLGSRADRIAVADAFDAAMAAHPAGAFSDAAFERTAVNGYGLLQIVRRRVRMSLCERLHFAPIASAALALLRRAERVQPAGGNGIVLAAHPRVTDWLAARPALVDTLRRRTGRSIDLRAETGRAIDSCDAC